VGRFVVFVFGAIVYAGFLGVFIYLAGFMSNFIVPKGIDDGVATGTFNALAINLGLIAIFAVQHTIMARAGFKQKLAAWVPPSVERSVFVLATSLVLLLLYWQWRPMTQIIWQADAGWARITWWMIFCVGLFIVLLSTFLIDHFELFGLRQVMRNLSGRAAPHSAFRVRSLYRYVRHPMYLGVLLAFWATPDMTLGHLVFAAGMTGYLMIGVRFEERDLEVHLGADYRRYKRRVPMIIPSPGKVHEIVEPGRAIPERQGVKG
jgi:methanethiol S-methyltransferase